MESDKMPENLDLTGIALRFFKSLRRLWVLVPVLALLLGGGNYLRKSRSYTPMYEAKAVFSVSSGYGTDDVFSTSYYYDNAAAADLAAAFPHLLDTDLMRDLMLAQLGTDWINGSISPSAVADTNLFELRVRSNSPQDAFDILQAVIDCYPRVAAIMVENPQVAIRQEPTLPTEPCNSFSGVDAAADGAVLGCVGAVTVIFLLSLLNTTFLTAEDIKRTVNLPLLATIPHVDPKRRRKRTSGFLFAGDDPGLSEALRGLRTKVRKQLGDKSGGVILVTSTVPGEGKSTIAANLALSLASEGHKVVLVDADLRNQTVGRTFGGGEDRKGLMDCLENPRLDVENCLRPVRRSKLVYLSGASTSRSHYSIDSKPMERVLGALTPRYDYVILDSPPCGVVSDTALLGRYADCVLFVVKQDHATKSQVLEAVTGLYERDLPLTGCIFNDVPRTAARSGYGYGYGYGYGKQSGQKKTSRR